MRLVLLVPLSLLSLVAETALLRVGIVLSCAAAAAPARASQSITRARAGGSRYLRVDGKRGVVGSMKRVFCLLGSSLRHGGQLR